MYSQRRRGTSVLCNRTSLDTTLNNLDTAPGSGRDDLVASPYRGGHWLANLQRTLMCLGLDRVEVHLAVQSTDHRITAVKGKRGCLCDGEICVGGLLESGDVFCGGPAFGDWSLLAALLLSVIVAVS